MRVAHLACLALAATAHAQTQSVCYTGYVMDTYCINRGRLLDRDSFATLDSPFEHTVHCLVDIGNCRNSEYEVLAPNPRAAEAGQHAFCRAYRLDKAGQRKVVEHARTVGACGSCTGNGTLDKGYNATIRGVVVDAEASPPRIQVTDVLPVGVGCPDGESVPLMLNCESGEDRPYMVAHGTLMILSWGLLLPAGVITARMLKHRPNALWFKIHRAVQPLGLLLALAGFIIALVQFDVFVASGRKSAAIHGGIGVTVMLLGLLQPINAFVRPHPAPQGEPKPTNRLVWEIVHKGSGYIATVLGFINVIIGTTVIPKDFPMRFQVTIAVFGVALIAYAVAGFVDGRNATAANASDPTRDTDAEMEQATKHN